MNARAGPRPCLVQVYHARDFRFGDAYDTNYEATMIVRALRPTQKIFRGHDMVRIVRCVVQKFVIVNDVQLEREVVEDDANSYVFDCYTFLPRLRDEVTPMPIDSAGRNFTRKSDGVVCD